ncbi:hypothetical protein WJX81_001231 [Elliptochloris bilobata]|uniref:peptidylprolyl isomerase n=1 Tax=Elliptochloris bilobata TaxID=381761 RepID=A0AAW1RII6_9CHLO
MQAAAEEYVAEVPVAGQEANWYALVANVEFMLHDVQNEALAEQLRERRRLFGEQDRKLDFFLVSEPTWLEERYPEEAKRVRRPCVALVSTDKIWITFMKLRLDRVLKLDLGRVTPEAVLAHGAPVPEFPPLDRDTWTAPYPPYRPGWWKAFEPDAFSCSRQRNSGALAATPEEGAHDDADMVGPELPKAKRRKVLEHEQMYLEALPCAEMYERSYMHRDTVTHIAVAPETDFFVTGSVDGHLKFWKKKAQGVEFAKHFRAHLGSVDGLAVSHDSALLVSISTDKSVKVFDVASFDMMAMLRLPFVPACAEWVSKKGEAGARLAIAERDLPIIHIYDARSGSDQPTASVKVHGAPVKVMRYNAAHDTVISSDEKGMIEYWSGTTLRFPSEAVAFRFKLDTDLYALAKARTSARGLEVSRDGGQFCITSADRRVRVFRFLTGKLRCAIDESAEAAAELQRGDAPAFRLDAIDFGRRLAAERELAGDPAAPATNAVFDDSGNFLLYATLLGIKVVNLVTKRIARVLGKVESGERFLRLALYQGVPGRAKPKLPAPGAKPPAPDPTLLACAYGKQRMYFFTRREPADADDPTAGRDVFNEKPTTDDALAEAGGEGEERAVLPRGAVLHTSRGDITLRLFPDECPRTVENFTTHARNGYYDNVIFHRVIKGFMVQTGDPLGDGTGGQSIWGGEFADEFSRNLRHDRPFIMSMANAGPGTNGSQFFITTVATPWLDNKHTVFGRVVKGADVVQAIERAKTDRFDKPVEDIKITNIETHISVE